MWRAVGLVDLSVVNVESEVEAAREIVDAEGVLR